MSSNTMLNIEEESFLDGVFTRDDYDARIQAAIHALDVRLTNREYFRNRFPHIWMSIWDNDNELTYVTIARTSRNVAGYRLLNKQQQRDLAYTLNEFSRSNSNDLIDCHALVEWIKTRNRLIVWHYPIHDIGRHCFKCTTECDYLQVHGKSVSSNVYILGVEGNYNQSRIVAWTLDHEDYSGFHLGSNDVIFHARMKTGHTHFHQYDRNIRLRIEGGNRCTLDTLEWSALNCMLNTIRSFLIDEYYKLWCLIDVPLPLKSWFYSSSKILRLVSYIWRACLCRNEDYDILRDVFRDTTLDRSTGKNTFFSWLLNYASTVNLEIRYIHQLPIRLPLDVLHFMREDQRHNGYQIRLSRGDFIFY